MGKIMQHGTLHTSINYANLIEAQAMEPSFLGVPSCDGENSKPKVKVMTRKGNFRKLKSGNRKSKH